MAGGGKGLAGVGQDEPELAGGGVVGNLGDDLGTNRDALVQMLVPQDRGQLAFACWTAPSGEAANWSRRSTSFGPVWTTCHFATPGRCRPPMANQWG